MGYDMRFHGDPHRPPAMEDTGEGQKGGGDTWRKARQGGRSRRANLLRTEILERKPRKQGEELPKK